MRWWFSRPADEIDTERLIAEVTRLRKKSRFQTDDEVREFITDLVVEVCANSELYPGSLVIEPLYVISLMLLEAEPFQFDLDSISPQLDSLETAAELRGQLRRCTKILTKETYYLAIWRDKMAIILHGIVAELPVNVLVDPAPDGTVPREPILSPVAPLSEFIDDLPDLLHRLIGTFYDQDIAEPELFHEVRQQFEARFCVASNIPWNERNTSSKPYISPIDQRAIAGIELAQLYTDRTYFEGMFTLPVPIPIPDQVRFEHSLIIGGTGHGKTQLLQHLIFEDLIRALNEKMSVVVIDPDGTLLRTLSQTKLFQRSGLGKRAIFIDPTDSTRPVGLNLFDISNLEDADTRTRETVENNTIELFEYFFDALLGSELTSRQSTLFRYLGLLLMQIPGGNIHTLRELMEDGEKFRPYMEKLSGTARTFFETRFFDKSLNATKQQILSRLWGVLSNRSLDRVFSAKRNTVDFYNAMQDGKIIFVNTSKEYLGEEGSHIFARMIVALMGQGLMRRAGIKPEHRTPTYIYVDEAEGVIDQTMVRLLAQVRKHKGAITLSQQHLDQISPTVRAGVLANTSIKLAGGVSAKDARELAPELRVDKDVILGQRKLETETCFSLFARNITPTAMTFRVPLGRVERFDRLSSQEYVELREHSRHIYGLAVEPDTLLIRPASNDEPAAKTATVAAVPAPISPPPTGPIVTEKVSGVPDTPVYRKEGGGGARHREIQTLIKELGEAAGFRVSLEETILDGEGRVDVILRRDDLTVCCEVSVTTTKEHELLNVQKCFRFEADEVWLVANSERHAVSLQKHITPLLDSSEAEKFQLLVADKLNEMFQRFGEPAEQTANIVKGYRVRSKATSKQFLRDKITTAFTDLD